MAARAAAHFLDRTAIPEGVVERSTQAICHEAEGVQEISLPGAIGADQKHQIGQANIARGDALVIAYPDSMDERRFHEPKSPVLP